MEIENEVEVGYSQRTAGANGMLTSCNCIGDPNVVALTPNIFSTECVAYQRDRSTNFQTVVWIMSGTPANPAWTLDSILDANVITKKVTIESADILTLNSTPVEIVAAPGAGKTIEVISVQGKMNFAGAAYATHTELDVFDTTSGDVLFKDTSILLAAAADINAQLPANANAGAGLEVTEDGSVSVTVAAGDPATGGGDLNLYITYKIITL